MTIHEQIFRDEMQILDSEMLNQLGEVSHTAQKSLDALYERLLSAIRRNYQKIEEGHEQFVKIKIASSTGSSTLRTSVQDAPRLHLT